MLKACKIALIIGVALPAPAWVQAEALPQAGVSAPSANVATTPLQPELVLARPDQSTKHAGKILVPRNTLVRLKVLSEVNTRHKKAGDRFVLRVDEPVIVDGVTIVPIGAKAWGEVTKIKESGAAGSTGKISAKLLHIDLGAGTIPLNGEEQSKGPGSGNGVAVVVVGFGVLGLLVKGNEGKLKGGHIFNGFVANDMLYDPVSAAIVPAISAAEPAPQ
jgi:hypothetical protein